MSRRRHSRFARVCSIRNVQSCRKQLFICKPIHLVKKTGIFDTNVHSFKAEMSLGVVAASNRKSNSSNPFVYKRQLFPVSHPKQNHIQKQEAIEKNYYTVNMFQFSQRSSPTFLKIKSIYFLNHFILLYLPATRAQSNNNAATAPPNNTLELQTKLSISNRVFVFVFVSVFDLLKLDGALFPPCIVTPFFPQ